MIKGGKVVCDSCKKALVDRQHTLIVGERETLYVFCSRTCLTNTVLDGTLAASTLFSETQPTPTEEWFNQQNGDKHEG